MNKKLALWKDQYNWEAASKTDKKREEIQIIRMKNEMGDITVDPAGI